MFGTIISTLVKKPFKIVVSFFQNLDDNRDTVNVNIETQNLNIETQNQPAILRKPKNSSKSVLSTGQLETPKYQSRSCSNLDMKIVALNEQFRKDNYNYDANLTIPKNMVFKNNEIQPPMPTSTVLKLKPLGKNKYKVSSCLVLQEKNESEGTRTMVTELNYSEDDVNSSKSVC